jgi:HlyD family secretion protein
VATLDKAGRRRAVMWSFGAILVTGLLWVAFRPQPVQVDTATVTRGRLQVTLDQEGRTRVHDRYVVSAPVAGRILRVELEPGDTVTAGQTVVATFLPEAPPLLDARSRGEALARVRAADAAVSQARAVLAEARGRLALADRERARMTDLFRDRVVPQASLDEAETKAATAAESVSAAEAAVAAAEHQAEGARASLVGLDSPSGGSTTRPLTMRSPVDGVVLQRLHESEAVVAAGAPIVEIGDPADLEVVADYLSTDAVRIHAGMSAVIDRWGGDHPLDSRVRLIEPYGFVKVSALGVEEQRVNVILSLADPRSVWAALGDGYRVEVRVVLWETDDALKVPSSALVRDGDGWAVFVADANRARLRAVSVGHQTGIEAEVLDGLAEGEAVLVHPSDAVVDGVHIEERGGG